MERVPLEVWCNVASAVEDPAELSDLSLVSHQFHAIVRPILNWRVAEFAVNQSDTPDNSILTSGKAEAIRTLTISDDGAEDAFSDTPLYDAQWRRAVRLHNGPKRSEEAFFGGLLLETTAARMGYLRSLSLCVNFSLLSSFEGFFGALSPNLDELQIISTFEWSRGDQLQEISDEEFDSCVQAISALKGGYRKFSWVTVPFRYNDEVLEWVVKVLKCCPELEELRILHDVPRYIDQVNGDCLWKERWANLRTLELSGFDMEAVDISEFWMKHDKLETLCLSCNDPLEALPTHALPALRTLECDDHSTEFVLSAFRDRANSRPIEKLTLEWMEESPENIFPSLEEVFDFINVVIRSPQLFQLTLTVGQVEDSEVSPWMRGAASFSPNIRVFALRSHDQLKNFERWRHVVAAFPRLQILGDNEDGLFLSMFELEQPPIEYIRQLGASCSHLRQVDDWVRGEGEDSDEWVQIPRVLRLSVKDRLDQIGVITS